MIQPYDVFVSYAREDLERVNLWIEELKKGGVSAFFDMESLLYGANWQGEITEAIRTAKIVIVFISSSSLASDFVPKELSLALDMRKNILPVLLENVEVTGRVLFCITGLHRVEAYDKDLKEVWSKIQAALLRAGVEWKTPSRRLIDGVRNTHGRDVSLDDGTGNVRITRKPEPNPELAPVPAAVSAMEEATHTDRWLFRWLVLMAVACAVILFFWMDGAGVLERMFKPTPKAQLVETLEEEAQSIAKDYYLAANQAPLSQLSYLAAKVNYLGHQDWTAKEVKAEQETAAKKWQHQQLDILRQPVAHEVEAGKTIDCDVSLRCTSENAVVKSIAIFTGRLRLQLFGGALKIVSVSEVPGSRKDELLQFQTEAQKKVVIDFVSKSVRSGSSDSGMTPESIAAMYVEKPDYFGRSVAHADIIQETQTLITRWEIRDYRVLEAPAVVSGLGTPNVEVKVGLDYRVSSPSRGGKINQGWVRSIYLVHFSADGTPLIQKHVEVERGQ